MIQRFAIVYNYASIDVHRYITYGSVRPIGIVESE